MHRKRTVLAVLASAALAAGTAMPAWAAAAPAAPPGGRSVPPAARAGRVPFSPLAAGPYGMTWPGRASGTSVRQQSYFEGVSCASAAFCAAVGTAYANPAHLGTLAETWNGTTWTVEPTRYRTGGTTRKFEAVSCTSASFCMAVGAYAFATGANRGFAETWNGTAWSGHTIPQPPRSDTTDVWGVACTAPDSCVVTGNVEHGSLFSPAAWRWNGTTWSILTVPSPTKGEAPSTLYGVSCPAAASCTATGEYLYGTDDFSAAPFAEHWDGTRWSIQRVPNKGRSATTALPGVSCAAPGACVAAGSFTLVKIDLFRPLAESWGGTSWKVGALSRPPHIWLGSLAGVSCTSASACTGAGSYNTTTSPNGQLVPLYERWNGTAWHLQAAPVPAHGASVLMDGVSCPAANACTAAGYVHGSQGFQAAAEAWNGDRWTVQATHALGRYGSAAAR